MEVAYDALQEEEDTKEASQVAIIAANGVTT